MIAWLLAVIPVVLTPPPGLLTPSPAPISERAVFEEGLDDAVGRAKALGGTLGVTIVDLTTGVSAVQDGDENLPMAGVQHLPIAVLVYRAADAGHLTMTRDTRGLLSRMLNNDDDIAADSLLDMLGGSEAANAQLRTLGYPAIFLAPGGAGYATPSALASLIGDCAQGKLLTVASTTTLMRELAGVRSAPGRLRAGFAPSVMLAHVPGTVSGGDDTNIATDDAGVAALSGRTVVVVVMLSGAHGGDARRDAVIAGVAATVARAIITP
jgi:beta-lactamase class A